VFEWDGSDESGLVEFLGDYYDGVEHIQGDGNIGSTSPFAFPSYRSFDVSGGSLFFQKYAWSVFNQVWQSTGPLLSIAVESGDLIHPGDPLAYFLKDKQPHVVSGDGWWESDQYGRPLDINDLEDPGVS